MTTTEVAISCSICEGFKRFVFRDNESHKFEGWLLFDNEVDGSTRTLYICPNCQKIFNQLFDTWFDKKIGKKDVEIDIKLEDLKEEVIKESKPKKKRGRPPKKKK